MSAGPSKNGREADFGSNPEKFPHTYATICEMSRQRGCHEFYEIPEPKNLYLVIRYSAVWKELEVQTYWFLEIYHFGSTK